MKPFHLLFLLLLLPLYIFSQAPATEIRAVWLTTNWGLDWPVQRTSVKAQKEQLKNILDKLQEANFNTVLFQARAQGYVFYRSKIEPLSSYFNHDDNFDPLAFAIEECHKRGMECHAWVIAYPMDKATVRYTGKGRRRKATVVQNKPSYYKAIGERWYLDPGNPQTDDYLLSIIREIVSNYDVDGIHFDYIRYPDRAVKFTDDASYRRWGKGQARDDWRRENINRFVAKAYDQIKKLKPWVMVSSSPLGRYKPLNTNPNDTWTAYYSVYQDPVQWLNAGKHDAVFPMMYYRDGLFYPYLDQWIENSNGRILVPGLGVYQIQDLGWLSSDIIDQIEYGRSKAVSGNAFFRVEHVLNYNHNILRQLSDKYYKYPAKMPPMSWLSDEFPEAPFDLTAEKVAADFQLRWKVKDTDPRITFNVYRCKSDSADITDGSNLLATGLREPVFMYQPPEDDSAYYYFVTSSNSFHNESSVTIPAFFWHSKTEK